MPFSGTACGLWHLGRLSQTVSEIFILFHLDTSEVWWLHPPVLSCVIPEGRDRNEPTFIYSLIAFCWGRCKQVILLCVNTLADFGRWNSARREDRLWEVIAPGIRKPVKYFQLMLQSKHSLVINSICKLRHRQWELWQWFTPIILICFASLYKIRLFGYFDNTRWQELRGCDIQVWLLLFIA